MNRLADKVVMITGSSGIGAATARLAVGEGAKVFVASLSADEGEALASELYGDFYAGDLSQETNAIAAVQACIRCFGRIDCVFNVAGISGRQFGDGPLDQCTAEGWDTTMRMNVRSLFLVSREAVKQMLLRGEGGSIVNMASVMAFSPEPTHFATHAYAAGKGAIIALTKSAAAYYAKFKIRINAVAPGLVETAMSKRAQESSTIREYMKKKQPLAGGLLSAGDVAAAALFLLSDESRHITGEVITIDGGWRLS